ncbi:MAG: hypothetical protein KBD37_10110 [Burkholderiales bacterium]|nr:hypothetical protein [Burkholderiales bacterium]
MDAGLEALLSWQFLLFCLGIAAITFVIRKIVEFAILDNPKMPGNKTSRLWNELLLPIGPVFTGAIISFFAKQYPYPNGIVSASGRILFGLVAGLLSGLIYRVIRGTLKSKIQVVSSDASSSESSGSI